MNIRRTQFANMKESTVDYLMFLLLQAYVLKVGEPKQRSGKQEHYESILNHYVWSAGACCFSIIATDAV